jgi:hypothetical protein
MPGMIREEDFTDIRPHTDNEINQALRRIISDPSFDAILEFFFPDEDKNKIRKSLEGINTAHDFQLIFMHPLVYSIVRKTSKGLTSDGFEQLTPGTPYLFIANHRDIVLDSAILQVLLIDNHHNTSEITFGSNLMINQFVIDLGKVNRMFKVVRGCSKAELIRNSQILSAYIRHTITVKKNLVWIAQRPGRTKDGNDKTEAGLLKMLNKSSQKDFADSFRELNIVPLVISYEYEPCCSFKVSELLETSIHGGYQKKPGEDLKSIITGLTQPKGRIHMSVGKPVNSFDEMPDENDTLNNKISRLAGMIDNEVYSHYRLWPNNYIACDILHMSGKYRSFYTPAEKQEFLKYMGTEIGMIEGDKKIIEELFLNIYANPLINADRLNSSLTD